MGAGKTYRTPGSGTKDSLFLTAIAIARISAFVLVP
jgi:hypothetical protein